MELLSTGLSAEWSGTTKPPDLLSRAFQARGKELTCWDSAAHDMAARNGSECDDKAVGQGRLARSSAHRHRDHDHATATEVSRSHRAVSY